MHEVAQVVGAAGGVSAAALAVATIVKLTRVGLLVPVMVVTAVIKGRARPGKRGNPVPLFVACFLGAVLIRSTGWLPDRFVARATDIDTALLACAMAGLGLTIDVAQLRRLGGRPLLLGATSSALLALVILGLVSVTS